MPNGGAMGSGTAISWSGSKPESLLRCLAIGEALDKPKGFRQGRAALKEETGPSGRSFALERVPRSADPEVHLNMADRSAGPIGGHEKQRNAFTCGRGDDAAIVSGRHRGGSSAFLAAHTALLPRSALRTVRTANRDWRTRSARGRADAFRANTGSAEIPSNRMYGAKRARQNANPGEIHAREVWRVNAARPA